MASVILITFREGLEASLIVGILLAFLGRVGAGWARGPIWAGVALGLAASGAGALLLQALAARLEGATAVLFEAGTAALAVGVLTSMVIWTQRQSRRFRSDLEAKLEAAVGRREIWALVGLAFVAVAREGLETVLFLYAMVQAERADLAVGGLIGAGAAVALVYALYKASLRVPLRGFFIATGVLLIFIAGGLAGHGVGALQERGLVPVLAGPAWDLDGLLPEEGLPGALLHALLGYASRPSVLAALVQVAYLALALMGFAWAVASPAPGVARPGKAA